MTDRDTMGLIAYCAAQSLPRLDEWPEGVPEHTREMFCKAAMSVDRESRTDERASLRVWAVYRRAADERNVTWAANVWDEVVRELEERNG